MFHKKEFRDLVLSPHESNLGIQDVYDADMWKTFLFNPLDNTEAFLSDPKILHFCSTLTGLSHISDPNTKFQLSC